MPGEGRRLKRESSILDALVLPCANTGGEVGATLNQVHAYTVCVEVVAARKSLGGVS